MSASIGVIGAGSFGTCLAMLCAQKSEVVLWSRNQEIADGVNQTHRNPYYLKDLEIPAQVLATTDLALAVREKDLLIFAVPSHGVRKILQDAAPLIAAKSLLVTTAKGIETETCMLMHQVFEDVLAPEQASRLVVLSGPSFAHEVAQKKPTVVTLASREESHAIRAQSLLSCAYFRCYSHDDVIGAELGGALKNVVAIAVGISDGLDLGNNARAAIMTRGLAEIARLGAAMGANPLTFLGLSGMGDLVLTCTGDLSRNRTVGLELGRGKKLTEILEKMNQVAEGVRTAYSAAELAKRHGVKMPIVDLVRSVLEDEITAQQAVRFLMSRQLRSETE